MTNKMVTKFDDVLLKAAEFGKELGLKCYTPNQINLDEKLFQLYIIRADELRPALYDICGVYSPTGKRKDLEVIAEKRHKEGYHVHISEIGGNVRGYVNNTIREDIHQLLDITFHEGAHRVGLNNSAIHEAAAMLIGIEASRFFYRTFGTKYDVNKVNARIDKLKKYSSEHRARLKERLKELENGELIPQDHPFNNARIYAEHIYFTHYPLMWEVYEKISSLAGFIMLAPNLPSNEEHAVKSLRKVLKY